MPGLNEDRERQVVPEWAPFDTAVADGEMIPLRQLAAPRFNESMLDELSIAWKLKPGLNMASDFVSAAFSLSIPHIADKAAQFILSCQDSNSLTQEIAKEYLNLDTNLDGQIAVGKSVLSAQSITRSMLYLRISDVKQRLYKFQLNPFLWTDLARMYTTLGQYEKADKAIKVALSLAPADRYILRVAARFYLHKGDWDLAHSLLLNSPHLKSDPWILSAEIAISSAIKKPQRLVKSAKNVLDASKYSPLHLSELAIALGTLEAQAGSSKNARKLIRQSLQQPSANACAQAAWISRKIPGFQNVVTVPDLSFEANAWGADARSDWRTAFTETVKWQFHQPFSSRPAIHGSYLCSTIIQKHEAALLFIENALAANVDDVSLMNNKAFALAQLGKTTEASRVLDNVPDKYRMQREGISLIATKGLIEYRAGRVETGRLNYSTAVMMAKQLRDPSELMARIYYALEEIRIGGELADALRKEALDCAARRTRDPVLDVLVKRLQDAVPEVVTA